jgi:hypothetical protein
MAIIVLRAWYLDSVLSAAQVQNTPPDLRLSKTGLLKTGMRADFLDEVDQVKNSLWFQRYLEGELVEFYIEGSGAYSISNLDLISREIYFNKRNTLTYSEPTIFFCGQSYYPDSTKAIAKVLGQIIEAVNRKHNPILPLTLEQTLESEEGTVAIDAALIRKIKNSLLVVADVTPIAALSQPQAVPLPSPQVCLEIGYSLQTKRPDQILLVHLQREELTGRFPFDIDSSSYLTVKDPKQLQDQLTTQVIRQLQRSKLITD